MFEQFSKVLRQKIKKGSDFIYISLVFQLDKIKLIGHWGQNAITLSRLLMELVVDMFGFLDSSFVDIWIWTENQRKSSD